MSNKEADSFPWEDEAKELVNDALDSIEVDEADGVVRVFIDGLEREFTDLEDLRRELISEVEDKIDSVGPEDASDYSDADELVDDAIFFSRVEESFETLYPGPDENQLLLRFDDFLADSAEQQVRIDLTSINEELIRFLASRPEQMRYLHPRKFEELVAELFRSMGYDVLLTPRSRDGGMDFRAFRKEPFGTLLTIVECKRYRERKVGVGIVRSLYGVLNMENAPHGVIATTSFFTRDAKAERELVRGRMSLSDFNALSQWLTNYDIRGQYRALQGV